MDIEKLRGDLDYIESCLRDIHKRAEDEARDLSDDESTQWDEGIAERDRLRDLIETYESRQAVVAGFQAGASERGDGAGFHVNTRTDRDIYDLDDLRTVDVQKVSGEYRSRALTAVEKRSSHDLDDASKARITDLLERWDVTKPEMVSRSIANRVLTTGSDVYQRAFEKYVRTVDGSPLILSDQERNAVERAMSLTNGAGGFAVPFPIDPTLINLGDGAKAAVRNFARVIPNWQTDTWQGLATTQMTASYDAEASEVSDDTTTFTQPQITLRTARAFVPASFEIIGDYPGLVADLRELMADAKMTLEATVFATGAGGSNQPVGIVTALTDGASQIDSAGSDTFAVADVFALADALPPRFRSEASRTAWASNIAALHDIREFGDAGNPGPFVLERNPSSILDYPWFEMSGMDSSITACADNKYLILGDWRNYVIVDRVGFNLEVVQHLFATANNLPNGQRGFLGWWRNGADSVNDNAFRMLDVT